MDDASPLPQAPAEAAGADPASPPGAPRWAKVFGIIAAVVLVLFLVLLLTGSDHGPGRHLDGGDDPAPAVDHRVPHP